MGCRYTTAFAGESGWAQRKVGWDIKRDPGEVPRALPLLFDLGAMYNPGLL